MRVAILSYGTRGDIGPMAYLGAELLRRGHEVTMLAPPDLVDLPSALGLKVGPVGPDLHGSFASEAGKRWREAPLAADTQLDMMAWFRRDAEANNEAALTACDGSDLVVAGYYFEDAATCIAEADRTPLALLDPAPWRHTPDAFVHAADAPAAPGLRPDPVTLRLYERGQWRARRGEVAGLRTRLGLPPTRTPSSRRAEALNCLQLQAISPALVRGLETWSPRRPLTGFLTPMDEDKRALGEDRLDPDLAGWLANGAPPLFVGFGSMPVLTEELLATFIGVAAGAGRRLLINPGWSPVQSPAPTDEVFCLRAPVAFDAVLPQCCAAVHHGGAGTTGTSAAAGVPTLICSVGADQPFWGEQVVRRGVGAHLSLGRLTRRDLADCVEYVLTPQVAARARALAAQIAAEPPAVPRAVDLLEREATG